MAMERTSVPLSVPNGSMNISDSAEARTGPRTPARHAPIASTGHPSIVAGLAERNTWKAR